MQDFLLSCSSYETPEGHRTTGGRLGWPPKNPGFPPENWMDGSQNPNVQVIGLDRGFIPFLGYIIWILRVYEWLIFHSKLVGTRVSPRKSLALNPKCMA